MLHHANAGGHLLCVGREMGWAITWWLHGGGARLLLSMAGGKGSPAGSYRSCPHAGGWPDMLALLCCFLNCKGVSTGCVG